MRGKFKRAGLSVVDQFASQVLDIKKPARLCVPADKNDEGILDPVSHLMCYQVRPARTP